MEDIQNVQEMIREGSFETRKGTIVMIVGQTGYSFFKLEDIADMIWNIGLGSVYTKHSDKAYTINSEEAFTTLLKYWIIFLKGQSVPYVEIHNY